MALFGPGLATAAYNGVHPFLFLASRSAPWVMANLMRLTSLASMARKSAAVAAALPSAVAGPGVVRLFSFASVLGFVSARAVSTSAVGTVSRASSKTNVAATKLGRL
ncbi:hypothetical protein ES703_106949 [subsurface metagenome]